MVMAHFWCMRGKPVTCEPGLSAEEILGLLFIVIKSKKTMNKSNSCTRNLTKSVWWGAIHMEKRKKILNSFPSPVSQN